MAKRSKQSGSGRKTRKSRSRYEVRKLEPAWTRPPVPGSFWESITNRRRYMKWLGKRLGFRKVEDWYKITTDDFKQNRGGTVLASHWESSAIVAVKECYPEYDWKDWLFQTAPRHYWKHDKNRRKYMKWLGEQLGYRRPADWYQITNQHFKDHKGGAFLIHYSSTVSAAVIDFKPHFEWKEWLFSTTPKGFWHVKKNRRRYMQWLGKKLGFKRPDDWYSVTEDDFRENSGRELLRMFGSSPIAVLMDYYPNKEWHEWKFPRVPVGFWKKPENRMRYVQWLAKHLKVKRPADWSNVRQRDFCHNYGGALLSRYNTYHELLAECVPSLRRRRK